MQAGEEEGEARQGAVARGGEGAMQSGGAVPGVREGQGQREGQVVQQNLRTILGVSDEEGEGPVEDDG